MLLGPLHVPRPHFKNDEFVSTTPHGQSLGISTEACVTPCWELMALPSLHFSTFHWGGKKLEKNKNMIITPALLNSLSVAMV